MKSLAERVTIRYRFIASLQCSVPSSAQSNLHQAVPAEMERLSLGPAATKNLSEKRRNKKHENSHSPLTARRTPRWWREFYPKTIRGLFSPGSPRDRCLHRGCSRQIPDFPSSVDRTCSAGRLVVE